MTYRVASQGSLVFEASPASLAGGGRASSTFSHVFDCSVAGLPFCSVFALASALGDVGARQRQKTGLSELESDFFLGGFCGSAHDRVTVLVAIDLVATQ